MLGGVFLYLLILGIYNVINMNNSRHDEGMRKNHYVWQVL